MLTPQPHPAAAEHVCRWDLRTEGKTQAWFQQYLPGECGASPTELPELPTRYCTGAEYWKRGGSFTVEASVPHATWSMAHQLDANKHKEHAAVRVLIRTREE